MLRLIGLSVFVLNMLAFKTLHETHAPEDWVYYSTHIASIVGVLLFLLGTRSLKILLSWSSLGVFRNYWHELLAACLIFSILAVSIERLYVSATTVVAWALGYSLIVGLILGSLGLTSWIVGPNERDA